MCTLSECCYCSNAVDLEINIYSTESQKFKSGVHIWLR